MHLTTAEKRLAAAVDFDEDVCNLLKRLANGEVCRLLAFTPKFKVVKADGVAAIV